MRAKLPKSILFVNMVILYICVDYTLYMSISGPFAVYDKLSFSLLGFQCFTEN